MTYRYYIINPSGDSNYTTYLQNPTTIDNAMKAAGATKLIELGKADAKQIGEGAQANIIVKWKEDILIPLTKALASEPVAFLKHSKHCLTKKTKKSKAHTHTHTHTKKTKTA